MDDQTLDERVHAAVGKMLSKLTERLNELEQRVMDLDGRHASHGDENEGEPTTEDEGPPQATQLPA